ncbi:cyclic nucleotide-binding domain-containing protein [Toxoplasma gondii VAND]|uniref:Cyclic nucleotide-binding domain-containing protein n=1 Tax=Toxoplasma gondii VAND TaxID=933077 RepID=A0A086PJ69_TOXGO|nr:cyclic nucleotide-binding domain-containing protein [Toxoplasma gondii VAND]
MYSPQWPTTVESRGRDRERMHRGERASRPSVVSSVPPHCVGSSSTCWPGQSYSPMTSPSSPLPAPSAPSVPYALHYSSTRQYPICSTPSFPSFSTSSVWGNPFTAEHKAPQVKGDHLSPASARPFLGTVRSISPAPQDAERSLASRGHFLPEKRPEQNGWQLAAGAGHQSRPDMTSLTHALSGSRTEESPRTEAALAGEVRSAGSRVLEHVVASPVKEASIRVSQEAPDVSLKKSRTLAERFFLISSPPKAPKAETRSAQDNEEREEGLDLTGGDDHVGTSSQQVKQSSFGDESSDPATSWERGESAASLESLFRGRSLQQKKKRWWAGLASSLGRRSRSVECGRRGGDAAEGRGAEESEKGRLPQDTPGSRSGPQSAAELRKETREGRGVRDEPGENESDLWRRPASPEEDMARKERWREKRERETLDESSSGFLPMTELLKGQGEGRAGRRSDSSFVSSRASTKKSVTTKLSRSLSRLFGGKKKKTKGKERAGEQADGTSEGRRHSADGGPRQAHGRRDSSTSVSSLSSRSGPSTDLSRSSSPCSPCFSASQWEEAFSSLPPIPPSVAALSDTCQDLLLDQLKVLERGVQQLLAGQGSDVVLACIADEPRISEVMKPNHPSGSAYRSQLLVDEKGHDEGGDLSRQGAVEGACTGERREGNSRGGGELGEGEASFFFSPERAQKVCRRSQIPRAVGRLREELTAEHTASIQLLTDERNRLVLNKLLVGIHEVRGLVRTFTDVSRNAQGEAAEILADAAQLRAWSAKHGELAEGRDLVEHYHRQVAESANGVIREYHRRCIQLNSDIQLMRDQISQVVHAAFLEASRLPPLHSLYASSSERNCVDAFLSSCPYSGDPRIFMVSPPFLSRLQLYALSHLPPSRSAHAPDSPAESPTGAVASSTASSLHVGRHAVVVPVSSSALFQPGRCVQSVPPGLLLRSSKEDLAALEHRLEGKWGSFNLFEAWQNDAMKWQWRDAMMQRNFATREEEIERWRRDSEARVLAAVDLRLQELWAGRMQELRRVAGENLEDSFVSLLVDRVPSVADVVQRVQQKRRATGSASLSSASSLSCFHFASALAAGVSNEEVEAAFLAAEDMRSRLVEVASSEVFRQLVYAQQIVADYREGKSREKLLGVLEETVGKQMREICHLRTRLEEESDLACQPDRIRDECQKTEAAITMLEEELIAMQEKRTLRQQRLLDLRDSAQTKLQRVTALFDDDQALCRSLEEQCAGERRRGERVERLWQEIGIEKLEEMKQELARLKGENVALQADLEVARFELDVKRKKEELKREEAQRRQAEAARKQQEMREKKEERERKKRALKERDVAERDDAAETQSQRKSPLDSSGLIVRWHKATSSPLPTGPGSQAGNEGEKKHEREAYGVEEWEADRASDSQGMSFSRASTSKRVGHFSALFKWPSSKRSSSTPAELRTREGESGCEDTESPNGEGPHLRATAIQAASQRPVDSGVGEAHKTSRAAPEVGGLKSLSSSAGKNAEGPAEGGEASGRGGLVCADSFSRGIVAGEQTRESRENSGYEAKTGTAELLSPSPNSVLIRGSSAPPPGQDPRESRRERDSGLSGTRGTDHVRDVQPSSPPPEKAPGKSALRRFFSGSPEWAAGLRRRPSSKKQDEGDEVSADRSGQKAGCAAAAQQAVTEDLSGGGGRGTALTTAHTQGDSGRGDQPTRASSLFFRPESWSETKTRRDECARGRVSPPHHRSGEQSQSCFSTPDALDVVRHAEVQARFARGQEARRKEERARELLGMRSSAASRGDSTKELSRDSSGNQDVEHRRQRNELPREGCVGWGQRTVGKEEPFSQDDETISGGMSHPEGAERGAYPSDGPHSGDTSLSLHADRDSEVQRRTPSKEEQSKANVLSPSSPVWQKHAALCSALGRLERTETSSARGRSPKAGGLDQKSESDMDVLEEETTQKEAENVGSGSSEARPTSECRDSGEAQAREGNSSVESEASHTFLPFVSSSSRTSPEEGLQLFFGQCRSSDRDQQSSDSRKRRAWEVEDTATPRALQEAREGSRVLEERAKDGNGNVPPLDLRGGNAGGTTERRSTFVSLEGIGLSRGSEHGKQNRGESVERLPTTGFPGSDGPAPTCGIKGDARARHTDNFSLPSGSSLHLVGPDGLCLFGRSSSSVESAWENRGAKRDSGDRGNSFSGAEAASRPSWEANEQGKGLTSESLVVGERQIPGLPTVAQFSNSGNAHDAPSDSNASGSARRSASAQTVAKRSPRPTTSADSERQFDSLGSIIEAGLDSGGGHSESSVPADIENVATHREKATGETVPQASSLQTTGLPSWSEIPGGPPVASCSSLRRTAGDNVPGGLPGEEQLSEEKRSSFVSPAPAGVSLSLLGSFGEGDGAQGQGNTAGEGRREHEPCGGLPRPRGGPEALSCDAPKAIFFSLSATESRVGEQNGETKQKEQVGPSSSVSAHHTVDAGEEEKAADPEDLAGGNQHLSARSVRIAGGCLRPRPFPADKLRFGELDEKGEDKDRKPETSPPRAGGGNEGKGSFPPFRSSLSRSFSCDSSLFSVPLTDERSSASRSPPASSPGFERDGYTAVDTPETEEDQQASPPPNQTTLRESVTVEPGEDGPMSFLLPSPRAALEPVGCSPSSSEREAEVRERGSDGAGKDSKRRRRTEFPFSASAPFSFRRSLDEGKALFRGSTFFSRKGGGREEKEATAGLLPRAGSLDFSILSRRGNKKVCSFGILGSVALDTWGDEEGGLVTEDSPIETFRFNLTQTSHETGQADVQNAVLNSPVFALFDVDEKRQILELLISSITHVTEECTIFHRGEKVDVLYFVERGELEMAAVGPDPENHAEEANLGEREESAVGSAPDSQEAELGNHRHSAMAFSVLQIPSGAFVLPRAFLRAGCTAYRVRAVKPSSLYKLTAQSFQTVANGAVLRRASDLLAYMLRCPILEALTKREASQLIPLMRWQQFLPNEIILHQEQISRTMLIVMKGKARGVRRLSRHGRPETLEYYEEGSCINYLCLLQELPNSTSVIAEQPEGCIVASLSASDFVGLMGSAERLLDRGQETADGGKGFSGRIDLGEVKKTWHKVLKMAGPR